MVSKKEQDHGHFHLKHKNTSDCLMDVLSKTWLDRFFNTPSCFATLEQTPVIVNINFLKFYSETNTNLFTSDVSYPM